MLNLGDRRSVEILIWPKASGWITHSLVFISAGAIRLYIESQSLKATIRPV